MSTTNPLLSVAETYAQMYKSAAKVERPHWVPSSIAEEHVNDFVKAIREARANKQAVVEFAGKKYAIKEEEPAVQAKDLADVAKDLEDVEGDSKEIKHDNVADAQAKADKIEKKPEEVKEEDELVGNQKKLDVNDNGKIDADDFRRLRAGEEVKEEDSGEKQHDNVSDKRAEADPEDTLPMMGESQDDEWKDYQGAGDEVEDEPKDNNPGEGEEFPLDEVLTKSDPASKWIHDFVHSTNPKFAGKSKEERRKMALGAYYSAQREATEWQPGLNQMLSVANTYAQMQQPQQQVNEQADGHSAAQKLSDIAHAASAAAKGTKDHELHSKARDAHVAAGLAHLDNSETTSDQDQARSCMDKASEHAKAAHAHEFMHYRYSRGAQVKEETIMENVAGDHQARLYSDNAHKASHHALVNPSDESHQKAHAAHSQAAEHYRIYAHHAGDANLRTLGKIHHEFHSNLAQYHMLQSIAHDKDIKEGTHNDAKAGPEVMDAATARAKAMHSSVKVEDRFNVGAAQDGAEKIMPSDKPKTDAAAGSETPDTPKPELETPKSAETGAEKVDKASLPANEDPKADFENPVVKNPTGAEGISQAPMNKPGMK